MVILISIHAPLTGSDIPCALTPAKLLYFNPRSPHRERRLPREDLLEVYYFNPRSPHRERRAAMVSPETTSRFQSTLPSQGATQIYEECHRDRMISIHAPLTGSDVVKLSFRGGLWIFQSTLPSQGATLNRVQFSLGCVGFQSTLPSQGATFSALAIVMPTSPFQSTLPSQGATDHTDSHRNPVRSISIHAPLTGSDDIP